MSLTTPLGAAHGAHVVVGRESLALGRERSRSRAGVVALGVLLLAGTVLAVCAPETNLLLPESVRPVPAWLAGPLGQLGIHLGTVALVTVVGVMFIAYLVVARRAERLSVRAVVIAIAALHLVILLAPPLVSTDIFSYQAYARMFSVYGADPYTHGPHAIALDGVYPYIGAKWVSIPTAYGPLFTAASALLAPLAIATSIIVYKGIATAASLTVIALVWSVARLRGVDQVKAIALVGLNPLLVVYGVGGGHNDMLMLVAVMASILLLLHGRERAGGASIAIAAGVKLTGGLLAPFALAGLVRSRARGRQREFLLGAAVCTAAIAGLALALFGTGSLHLLSTLHLSQSQGDWHSIPGFIATRLGLGTIGHVAGFVLGGVFLLILAGLLRAVARGQIDWLDGAAWATAAMLATASSLLPWYVAWLMPLAAIGRDRRLVRVGLILSGMVTFIDVLGYVPHAGGFGL
jgi:alpha-1,6-mannosyltransferase